MSIDVAVVLGTRPEVVKLAPVIQGLNALAIDAGVVNTRQHGDMAPAFCADFGITPRWEAVAPGAFWSERGAIATPIEDIFADLLRWLAELFARDRPRLVLVQGDTTTALVGAFAAFLGRIPVGHVEAGLRTCRPDRPFPEEMNRRLVSRLAALHFAPTQTAVANLAREGIRSGVYLTGNPFVDVLARQVIVDSYELSDYRAPDVLVTCHRREALDRRLGALIEGVRAYALANPERRIVWPVHPNPVIRPAVKSELGALPNVALPPPLPYREFGNLLRHARLVVTDSGGVIEEAATLGVPLLILRDETERPEAEADDRGRLVPEAKMGRLPDLIEDALATMSPRPWADLFGDGQAGPRIAGIVRTWLDGHHPVE